MNAREHFVECVKEIVQHNIFYRETMYDSACPWTYDDVAKALAIHLTNDDEDRVLDLLSEEYGHNLSFNREDGALIPLTIFVSMIAEKFETMFD